MTRPSIPCRWCGWRASHLYASPEKVLADHVAECPLSIPCDYCGAGKRVRCTTIMGKPSPFHAARRLTR